MYRGFKNVGVKRIKYRYILFNIGHTHKVKQSLKSKSNTRINITGLGIHNGQIVILHQWSLLKMRYIGTMYSSKIF